MINRPALGQASGASLDDLELTGVQEGLAGVAGQGRHVDGAKV